MSSTALSISSRTHAASLLPIDAHSPALLALVAVQVDPEILQRMAFFVIRLVQPYNYGLLTPPSTPPSPAAFPLANLVAFIDNIMLRSRGTFATLLVARIYLQRLRSQLPYYCPAVEEPTTPHRVFYAAFIAAHKFINDSSMVNKHWAEVSNIFDNSDILAMEAQFLKIIRYNLVVSEPEVFEHGRELLGPAFLQSSFWDL